MPTSTALIAQVEEALGTPKILDRDLVQDLLGLAKALEAALIDVCRENLELKSMDQNVASAADSLKQAIDQLNASYTQAPPIDEKELDNFVENQLNSAKARLR